MNQPWIYMCSPSWTPLPPPSPSHPSGLVHWDDPEGWDGEGGGRKGQDVRPKIRAFVPRRKNHATQWTSPADATSKRVYYRLHKPGDSDLLRGRAHRTANWASFYRQKPHYQHITYGLQSDWLQHYLYHISTQVIRGTQMFVPTCSWNTRTVILQVIPQVILQLLRKVP